MSRFNSTFSGHVPERLKYVQRPASMVTDYWEHDLWDDETKKRPGVMLRETFVVDTEFESGILKIHFPDDRDPAFVDIITTRDDSGVIVVTTY